MTLFQGMNGSPMINVPVKPIRKPTPATIKARPITAPINLKMNLKKAPIA